MEPDQAASMVGQGRTENPGVGGSIPSLPTIFLFLARSKASCSTKASRLAPRVRRRELAEPVGHQSLRDSLTNLV